MPVDQFLQALRVAARSNYAFVAYIGVLAAWVYIAGSRARLRAMTKSLSELAVHERADALKRLYPEFPTTGMSADEFIRSRRNGQLLIAFITLVVAVAIMTIALARASAR